MTTESKPRRFLRIHDVERKIGLKKSRIYELIADQKFPKAIKLTGSTNVWYEHVIDAWMDKQAPAEADSGSHTGDHSGGQSGGSSKRRPELRAVQS